MVIRSLGIGSTFANFNIYKTFRELIETTFGAGEKKLITLSGNWETRFMNEFTELFDDFDAVAWHWYPLGAGR